MIRTLSQSFCSLSRALLVVWCLAAVGYSQQPNPMGPGPRMKVISPDFSSEPPRALTFVPHRTLKRPKVALVLSGGGSRGVAAIGALKVLEEADIPLDYIVGTSMGAIIGGLYASGYSTAQLERMVDTTRWDELLSFSDEARRRDLFYDQKLAEDRSVLVVRFKGFEPIIPSAYSTGQNLLNYLSLLTLQGIYHPNPSFDNLRIPFRAVATDLVSGRRVVLDRGDLAEAMRATMTVPLLFSPVLKDSMQLVDGGLVANVPTEVARELGAQIVIAVDATSPLRPVDKLQAPWEIADQIMGVVMGGKKDMELRQADVVIRPELGGQLSTDFTRLQWIVKQGEEAARRTLPDIQQLLRQRARGMFAAGDTTHRPYPHPRVRMDGSSDDPELVAQVENLVRQGDISEHDVRLLVNEIYDRGDVERVECTVVEYADSTQLLLKVAPKPVLTAIEIIGANVVSFDTLLSIARPLVGKRLNARRSTRMFENLLAVYRDRGLSLAKLRSVRFDRATGRATITIDEGIVFRRDIRGTTKTKDYVIWRELPWDEGEVFDVSKIARGIQNLYATNLFEFISVGVHTEGAENELNVVTINVRERSTELIRFGLRVDNERNLQPSLDVRDENLLGIGMELGGRVYGGQRNRGFVGEFKASRIFNTYLTFGLKGYYEYRDVNLWGDEALSSPTRWSRVKVGEYRQLRSGGSVVFGTQLERLGLVTVEGRLETHRVWSISGNVLPTESFRFASLKFGTSLDTQDRYPFPREGVSIHFFYESALVKVASNVGFTKLFFNYDNYVTYFGRHTLRPRLLFGFADETLPITEQFSLGGQSTFYGLREDDRRGRQFFVASLEYRYQVPWKLFFETYLNVRYDFGSLWAVPEAIRLSDLRHGLGVGLAFDTPVGPAEFAVGRSFYFRKDLLEHPLSLGPVLFYFSIGYPL
jgi:NTE family protein